MAENLKFILLRFYSNEDPRTRLFAGGTPHQPGPLVVPAQAGSHDSGKP